VRMLDRVGLRWRLALLVGLGTVLVGASNHALLATLTRGWLERELETRAAALATASAERVSTFGLASDSLALAGELQRLSLEADVMGAAFHRADGARAADAGARSAVWRTLPWHAPGVDEHGALVRPVEVGSEQALEVLAPVVARHSVARTSGEPDADDPPLGWVRVLVSTANVGALLGTALKAALVVMVLSLLITLAALGWVTQRMLRPLREAGALAREIAAGQLDRRLPVRGTDELATLATSLNSMAGHLAQARAQARAEASALRVAAEAVIAIAREARASSDPQTVFTAVASELRRLTGSSGVALMGPEAGTGALLLRGDDGAAVWQRIPRSAAFERDLGDVIVRPDAAPARVALEPRSDALSRMLTRGGALTGLLVPVPLDDAPPVVLLLVSERADAFPASAVDVVAGLSSHLASALQASAMRERLQRSLDDLEGTRAQLLRSERLRVAGEMASGIAHDFNNVLGAIQGRAQLLRHQARQGTLRDESLARSLEIMEQAARDGAETVRRLRQFGRPGEAPPTERVSVGVALREAVEYTRARWENESQAAGRRIEVVQEIDPEVWITGRASELREVFTNLLLNAIDALATGGTLRVGCVGSGAEVRAWVEDDGIGMPPEVRARIFDPFFTTKGERGTGLGLPVVYGIVQHHGGRLEVESEPGRGTRFELAFPRAEAGASLAPLTPTLGLPAPREVLDVLVVDDEPAVRDLLCEILGALGHRATAHTSGESTLEFFERGRYQLVVSDLGLPGMSGWTLARRLRTLDPELTIAFVTGWGAEMTDEKVAESGADGFIGKPFGIEDVEALVRLTAERRGSRGGERREAA
jgi:signal transduction histidine kinase/CheY-like chemotaxis protein/HAMP domain-containing protein